MRPQKRQLTLILKNFRLFNLKPGISVIWNGVSRWDQNSIAFFLKLLESWYIRDLYLNDSLIRHTELQTTLHTEASEKFNIHLSFSPNLRTYLADHPDQTEHIISSVFFSTEEYVITGENWGQPVLRFYGHQPERIDLPLSKKPQVIKIKHPLLVHAVFMVTPDSSGRLSTTDISEHFESQKGTLVLPKINRENTYLLVVRKSFLNAPSENFNYYDGNHLSMLHHIFRSRVEQFPFAVQGLFYDFNQIYPPGLPGEHFLNLPLSAGRESTVQDLLTYFLSENLTSEQTLSFDYAEKVVSHLIQHTFPKLAASPDNRLFIDIAHPLISYLPLTALFVLRIDRERFFPETPYFTETAVHIKRACSYRFNQKSAEMPVVFDRLIPTIDSFADLKHQIDLLFTFGANHLFMNSPDFYSEALGDPEEVFNRNDANFSEYYEWFSYIHQLSNLLSSGSSRPEVLVLHSALECDVTSFHQTLRAIELSGLTYELVDFQLFESNKSFAVEDGRINFKGKNFRILILPHLTTIPLPVLKKLHQFVISGGILIAMGDLPSHTLPTEAKKEFEHLKHELWFEDGLIASTSFKSHESGGRAYYLSDAKKLNDLITDLDNQIRLQVVSEPGGVKYIFRETPQHYILFIVNPFKDRTMSCTAHSRYRGVPFLWDFSRAESAPLLQWQEQNRSLIMHLELAPAESQLILIDKNKKRNLWQLETVDFDGINIIEMGSRFGKFELWKRQPGMLNITFLNNGKRKSIMLQVKKRLPILRLKNSSWFLDSKNYHGKISLGDHSRLYPFQSDPIVYQKIILLNEPYLESQKLWLDLGQLQDWCAVYINEKFVAKRFTPPWRFDITNFMRPGENKLSIMIFHTMTNFLAKHNPAFPVRPYGLYGPVKIIPYELFKIKVG